MEGLPSGESGLPQACCGRRLGRSLGFGGLVGGLVGVVRTVASSS